MSDNLLVNLNIISRINLGDKVYMNDEGFITIDNSTVLQGLIRFVFRNSRIKTINNLTNFYSIIFDLIDSSVDCSKSLEVYMRKSLTGLENLKETYSSDIVTTSKLDIILDNVRLYISKLDAKKNNC
jgi:uncharacterized protein YsxB (DUF464 family)